MKISMKIGSLPFLSDARSYTCILLRMREICNVANYRQIHCNAAVDEQILSTRQP